MTTRRHFTLIEVAASIGIFLAVTGVGGLLLVGVQTTWRTVAGAEARLRQLQGIERVWDGAVRNAVPFYWKDRNNREMMLFSGGRDQLFLTCLHRIGNRETGGLRFLKLRLSRGNLIAEYRRTPILPETAPDDHSIQSEVIAEKVKKIQFRYVDLRDDQLYWYDEWDCEQMRNIPAAIQLEVEFVDGQREAWLRRTAGAGRFQQLGNRLPSLR